MMSASSDVEHLWKELVYLTDVKMLAHLALLYRIPRPLRCGGQQEFSNAFLRFCAIVGVDDEMVGWLRMLYIPDVFWSLKEGIRKSLEHPGSSVSPFLVSPLSRLP